MQHARSAATFQSTRPRGRTRPEIDPYFRPVVMFQSTRPRGRTRRRRGHISRSHPVSIHASSREDATVSKFVIVAYVQFQSTRPRGRTRLKDASHSCTVPLFQSTRPRGRTRQAIPDTFRRITPVSIHASSREDATGNRKRQVVQLHGFNPRVLAGGRDNEWLVGCRNNLCFNPRVLAGGRDVVSG